jgi:hypothetical protein
VIRTVPSTRRYGRFLGAVKAYSCGDPNRVPGGAVRTRTRVRQYGNTGLAISMGTTYPYVCATANWTDRSESRGRH